MPVYNLIRNGETTAEYFSSYDALQIFLVENPDVAHGPNGAAIVSGVNIKPDRDFRNLLTRIKKGYKGNKINDF